TCALPICSPIFAHGRAVREDRRTDRRARFFIARARTLRPEVRRAMIDPDDHVPTTRQCRMLDVPRSTVYYRPKPAPDEDLTLMARIDRIHLDWPFLGSRRIAGILRDDGLRVNRKRVQRLMRTMGFTALSPSPCTTVASRVHKIYPFLLRDLVIDHHGTVLHAAISYW